MIISISVSYIQAFIFLTACSSVLNGIFKTRTSFSERRRMVIKYIFLSKFLDIIISVVE
jgi:hypothetical protein